MKTAFIQILLLIALFLQSFNSFATQSVLNLVSQNLRHFYDDKNDGFKEKVFSTQKYQRRLTQLVNHIATEFNFAEVLAFQEIENKAILLEVSKRLEDKFDQHYQPILIEGNDISGIDVGFLVKKSYRVKSIKSLFQNKLLSRHREKLFSRPPLLIELCQTECLTIVNVHLRSMRGLRSSRKQKRISLKRRLQAQSLARWIDKFQQQHADKKLIIVGDFNALTPSDAYVDSLGIIIGKPDQIRPKWKSPDLIKNDLIDTTLMVNKKSRYSYKYRKRKQLLDYLLISKNLNHQLMSISFTKIDYKFSDHAALKAQFVFN